MFEIYSNSRTALLDYMELPLEQRQAHLRLNLPCVEIGTDSKGNRALLAMYLNTSCEGLGLKTGYICHACGNERCNNPEHLYWGTARENSLDRVTHNPDLGIKIRDILLEKNPNHFKEMASKRGNENRDGQKLSSEELDRRFELIKHLNPGEWGFFTKVGEVWGISPQAASRFYKRHENCGFSSCW